MAVYRKELLKPGIYRKADQAFRVTPSDIQQMVKNNRRMQEIGYAASVPVEHSPGDGSNLPVSRKAMSARELAKYHAGWVKDLEVDKDGTLFVVLDVKSKSVNEQIKDGSGLRVSPEFGPWKFPGDKDATPNTITHVAITPFPVASQQSYEFQELPESTPIQEVVQMSQLVSFSMAEFVPPKKNNEHATSDATPGDGDSDNDQIPDDDEDSDDIQDQMPDVNQDGTNDESAILSQILEILKEHGIVMPQGTQLKGELKVLLAGAMSAAHAKNVAKAESNPQPDPMQQQPGYGQQDPRMQGAKQEQMMTMSQNGQNDKSGDKNSDKSGGDKSKTESAPADTKTLSLAEWTQMSQAMQNNDAMAVELTNMKRDKYKSRIDSLVKSGRIAKARGDVLLASVQTYQFSASASSTEIVKLDAQLELAEELPEGAVWNPAERMVQMSVSEHANGPFFGNGTDASGGMTDAEIEADLDRIHGKPKVFTR